MRPIIQALDMTATGAKTPVAPDIYKTPFNVGVQVTAGAGSASKLQYTQSDPWAAYATDWNTNGIWVDAAAADGFFVGTASGAAGISYKGDFIAPVRGIRLNETAGVAVTTTATFVQAGGPG